MKTTLLLQFLALPLLCCLLPAPRADAATTITAQGAVIDGDDNGGFGYNSYNEISDSLFLVEGSGSGAVEYPWAEGIMVLEGESRSRTRLINGGWTQQAYSRASLTNPHNFTDSDHDVKTLNGEAYIPYIFGASAISRIVTDLQFGSTAVGYTARPVFRVHGEITNLNDSNNTYASIGFQIYNASLPSSYLFQTDFDVFIAGESAPVGDGLTLDISTIADVQFRTSDLVEGDTYYGTWHGEADFYHTLELVGIDVRDEEGNLVADAEIFNADGSAIRIVNAAAYIPEPSAALLLLFSALAISQRRMRHTAM